MSAAILRRPGWELIATDPLPWGDRAQLVQAASEVADRLIGGARDESHWAIVWAAGAAVTSSSDEALAHELSQISAVLSVIAEAAQRAGNARRGSFFFASSAGGVYGGSESPPFTELTRPAPISGYGRFKLSGELLVQEFAESTSVPAVSGRIANIYGPGQKLEKMQGLISHLAKAQLSPRPASIFVPLDTIRDYIYVRDCAELVVDTLARLRSENELHGTAYAVKNIASGQAVTISALLGLFRSLAKGHPHVMLGSSPESALQSVDLRISSVVWPELDARSLTPLPAGIKATIDDVMSHIQRSGAALTK